MTRNDEEFRRLLHRLVNAVEIIAQAVTDMRTEEVNESFAFGDPEDEDCVKSKVPFDKNQRLKGD